MTSSIYPQPVSIDFVGSIFLLSVTDGGTGYSGAITVTIDPPSGTTAIASSTINAGTVSSISITNEGAGYTSAPSVTIAAPVSGTQATATANLSNGKVVSITITDSGSGYISAPSVTIAAPSGTTATATATESGSAINSITLTDGGSGYTSAPSVSVTGAGGGSDAVIAVIIASLSSASDILSNDIEITNDMVSPGGGGILRLYFAFTFTSSPGTIGVFNNSVFKGNLNADNDSQVVTDGYYRFDIDVEAGDSINLQLLSGTGGDSVSVAFTRAHLVQFGAW